MASFLCVDVKCYSVRDSLIKNVCIHLSCILIVSELNPYSRIGFFIRAASNFPKLVSKVQPLQLSCKLSVWCVEASGFFVGTQPAVVAIGCGALLAAPWIFFAGVGTLFLGDHFASAVWSSGKLFFSHGWLCIGVKVCEFCINIYHIPA